MKSHSLTLRISASFAMLSACVLLALGWVLYRSLDEHVNQNDAEELDGKIALVRSILTENSPQDTSTSARRLESTLVGHPGIMLHVQRGDGATLFASAEWLKFDQVLKKSGHHDAAPAPAPAPGTEGVWSPERGRYYRVTSFFVGIDEKPGERIRVFLGVDVSDHVRILRRHLVMLVAALTGALAASTFMGWWITRRELGVVRKIAATARNVSSSSLGARLDIEEAPAELRGVVEAFNSMLARLEESFERLSQFSGDLAHELRTPIHNLMMAAHVALNGNRTASEYRTALEANAEEVETLGALVEDMLFLAKADRVKTQLEMEMFDLREDLDKVISYFELLAEEREMRIETSGHARVYADRRLVRRVMGNLVSNAIYHGEAGGIIGALVDNDGGVGKLTVTNAGPGISADMQKRIFDRFFQIDRSRSPGKTGWGLGLAIVKCVMDLHGGSVEVRSCLDGPTAFTVKFAGVSNNQKSL